MFFHLLHRAYEKGSPAMRNITVSISLGEERELSFEKMESRQSDKSAPVKTARISVPQTNNSVCTIGRDVNIRFRHGIAIEYMSCQLRNGQ